LKAWNDEAAVGMYIRLYSLELQSTVSSNCVQRSYETGIANVIVTPNLYERNRLVVTRSKFLLAEGVLQNQDGVIHVKAIRLQSLSYQMLEIQSHDFH
jgi:hypothetical protein